MNKNWYAVITADILYSKDISPRQKLLCALISNMSNEKGFCFATNKYFSEILDCSKRTIQDDLKKLEDLSFIGRVIHINEKGEVDYRALTPMRQVAPPNAKNNTTPHATDCTYNNKHINNKDNNLNIIPKNQKNGFKAEVDFGYEDDISVEVEFKNNEITSINYLNKEKEKSSAKKEKDVFEIKVVDPEILKAKQQMLNDTTEAINKALGYNTKSVECYKKCLVYFENDLKPSKRIEIDNWISTIDKLNRIDGLSFNDIVLLVKSARSDSFWSKNFLSLVKLRRKDKDKVPYWKVFKEKFKVVESKSQTIYSAYEQAKRDMEL